MCQNHNSEIDILLAKHFANEKLSPSEYAEFIKWKKENKQKYIHLKKLICKASKTIIVDTDKAWKKILHLKDKNNYR